MRFARRSGRPGELTRDNLLGNEAISESSISQQVPRSALLGRPRLPEVGVDRQASVHV